ncbi:expressed unknown protein [Seminavis robusta]|uniref:Uncharacterized protein n=1 Tax=Seminavis robusta TaxID=568900 RepID=A0A9N8D8X6_9STRA|nr:expressed unknown protein [Seminavis robusta]|eukprot:Sro44_g026750.1 n/a (106) ;mRNA; f:144600-144917
MCSLSRSVVIAVASLSLLGELGSGLTPTNIGGRRRFHVSPPVSVLATARSLFAQKPESDETIPSKNKLLPPLALEFDKEALYATPWHFRLRHILQYFPFLKLLNI